MIERGARLTPNFRVGEMIPENVIDLPADVLENLLALALLLERVRWHFGLPVLVNSALRLPDHNEAVGGSTHSDHLDGRAADFHLPEGEGTTWEQNTIAAFGFIRDALAGKFGQVILEDHREFYGNPHKLWVHVAIPSPHHPGGSEDRNAVLLSTQPKQYSPARGRADDEAAGRG